MLPNRDDIKIIKGDGTGAARVATKTRRRKKLTNGVKIEVLPLETIIILSRPRTVDADIGSSRNSDRRHVAYSKSGNGMETPKIEGKLN